ncbi:Rid family detoxifying hydrolase [Dactylosporangium fulvum]|uniref:Rid family detoxifying hydrolase n=1 Tax=Dactylosporangium fulvum TaxID=53359 RepID=A0ABY5WA67_9ACTN|nr:Rid family detoxifying hydrolase [Dactylosporangium fulvum]UWP86928.1 Rid family detoxifying hydrolase [Dactylosporangium fulvum]
MKQIRTDRAPAPAGAYSQGLLVNGLLFTAGMGPADPVTRELVGRDVEEQTVQVLRNLDEVLRAGGSSLSRVVKVTVHLADLADFAAFDRTYRRLMSEPYPVRTTVGSALAAGMLVEIDCVAAVEGD